jgi:Domain of unknown function (DUF222)
VDQPADTGTMPAGPADDAAREERPPDWLFPEERPPDPDDEEWLGEDLDGVAALAADAQGADDAGWRETLLAAGIGTGWAHYPGAPPVPGAHCGPGGGFGQGQAHDVAGPEPRLAALADQAAGPDRGFGGVGDDELMGVIGARNRLSSRQSWELLTALAELIRRRPAPYCEPEGRARLPRVWAEGTSAEVSIQLAITQRAATGLLGLAWDLAARLPKTSAALRDGVFDQDKAGIVASWCATLDETQAQQAEDLLFKDSPDLATMTWSMIRDRIARAVMTIDPGTARKRREHATRDARVENKLEQSGNRQIAAREIPPAAALAVDKKLTDRARALKKAGIKGPMSRLRVLAYLERFGVLDPFTAPRPEDGIGGGPIPAHDGHDAQDGQDDHDAQDGQHRQDAADGEWPEDWPRDDGRDNDGRGDSGPDSGRPDDSGPEGDGPGAGPDSGGGPGGGCSCGGTPPAGTATSGAGDNGAGDNGAGDNGMAGWLHLTIPASTLLEHGDRAGQLNKLGPVDADLARHLADKIAENQRSTICVTVTGPDGRPVAHACGQPARSDPARQTRTRRKPRPPGGTAPQDQVPPALTPAGQPDPAAGYGTWRLTTGGRDLDLDFETLTGPCDHKHEAPGHDPGKLLAPAVRRASGTPRSGARLESTFHQRHRSPASSGHASAIRQNACVPSVPDAFGAIHAWPQIRQATTCPPRTTIST